VEKLKSCSALRFTLFVLLAIKQERLALINRERESFDCGDDALNSQMALFGVIVSAKNERAKKFYAKYGFQELPDHPLRLVLAMKKLQKLFS
jgi:hypothetical protein